MSNAGNPPPTPKSPQKQRKFGLFTIVVTGGALVAFALIVFVIMKVRDPEGQRWIKIISASHDIASGAQTAPGTRELRKLGGCQQALVMTKADIEKVGAELYDGGLKPNAYSDDAIILCVPSNFGDPPSCNSLAEVYVDAVHPQTRFRVIVKRLTSTDPSCNQGYDSLGNPLR